MLMKKITRDDVAQAAERWQRCRQEDLPRLFYAYNDSSDRLRSERVVSYQLGGKKVETLTKKLSLDKPFNFAVHLGAHSSDLQGPVPDSPAFTLFLEAAVQTEKKQAFKCQELSWAKNSRFNKRTEDDVTSRRNAIPAASAYLFVQSWLELPEVALARPFSATAHMMGKRVKSYLFTAEESRSILRDIKLSETKALQIHLGNGLAVDDHPYSFRPVVEVKGGATKESNKAVSAKTHRLVNEQGIASTILVGLTRTEFHPNSD